MLLALAKAKPCNFSIFRVCSDPYVTTSTSYWGIRFSPIVAILELGRTLGTEQKVFCSSPSLLGDERKVFRSVPRVLPSLRSTSTRGLAELSLLSINKKNWMKFWNTSASGGLIRGPLVYETKTLPLCYLDLLENLCVDWSSYSYYMYNHFKNLSTCTRACTCSSTCK